MNTQEIRGDTVAILGLGKVGTAVGFLLRKAGYRIVAVASRSKASLNQGIVYTGGKPYLNFSAAAVAANCIIITTSDDAISHVCKKISSEKAISPGDKVIHMSGAGGLDLLESAQDAGARVACIHPLQSFADVDGAIRSIPGSTFGITSSDEIREWSVQMVRDLGRSALLHCRSRQTPLPCRSLYSFKLSDDPYLYGRRNLSIHWLEP